MNSHMGIWIDHRKAVVVDVSHEREDAMLVISNVERQLRRSGDSPLKGPYETRRVPADDSRQRALTAHLNIYYDAVVACLRKAEWIVILGPGEAKGELKVRLEKHKLGSRIAAIETVDKMTDGEIQAKVREHFQNTIGGKNNNRDVLPLKKH